MPKSARTYEIESIFESYFNTFVTIWGLDEETGEDGETAIIYPSVWHENTITDNKRIDMVAGMSTKYNKHLWGYEVGIEIKISKADLLDSECGKNFYEYPYTYLLVDDSITSIALRYLTTSENTHVGLISVDGDNILTIHKYAKFFEKYNAHYVKEDERKYEEDDCIDLVKECFSHYLYSKKIQELTLKAMEEDEKEEDKK